VQYVQREAALGTAALYGDIQVLAKESTDRSAWKRPPPELIATLMVAAVVPIEAV